MTSLRAKNEITKVAVLLGALIGHSSWIRTAKAVRSEFDLEIFPELLYFINHVSRGEGRYSWWIMPLKSRSAMEKCEK